MGAIDWKEWPNKRTAHCSCLFCCALFSETDSYTVSPSGNATIVGPLKDGEVCFVDTKEVHGKGRYWVGPAECLKKRRPSEYTPVEAPIAAIAISTIAPPGGMTCTRCNQNNPYAAPNKRNKEGQEIYVCYGCR